MGIKDGHITELDGASCDRKISCHEGVARDIRVATDADPSGNREGARTGRPRLLGVQDGDGTKLDGASSDGQVASHESVARDIDVAADADPSSHGEGTCRGRPRLLGVEDGDVAKLNRASGHRKIAS